MGVITRNTGKIYESRDMYIGIDASSSEFVLSSSISQYNAGVQFLLGDAYMQMCDL